MTDDLPPGFKRVSGTRSPKDGEYYVLLRCGFATKEAYAPGQLIWQHNGGSGDVIAVKPAGE